MKIAQKKFTLTHRWETTRNDNVNTSDCELVMAFGSKELLQIMPLYEQLKANYPNAHILINSTAGEIIDMQVNEETISLTTIKFEKIESASTIIDEHKNSSEAEYNLAKRFNKEGLNNLLVNADGQMVNGSDTAITGFYAYAKFSTSLGIAECQLYNQTMAITTLTEN